MEYGGDIALVIKKPSGVVRCSTDNLIALPLAVCGLATKLFVDFLLLVRTFFPKDALFFLHQIVNASDEFICSLHLNRGLKLLKALEHLWFMSLHLQLKLLRSLPLKQLFIWLEGRHDLKNASVDRWRNWSLRR